MKLKSVNQNGTTLVELVVSSALVGVMALLLADTVAVQMKGAETGTAIVDMSLATHKVAQVLSDPRSCRRTLGGTTLPPGASSTVTIPNIIAKDRSGADQIVISTGDQFQKGKKVIGGGNGAVEIDDMSLSNFNCLKDCTGPQRRGYTTLLISFKQHRGLFRTVGTNTTQREIIIDVVKESPPSNAIVACETDTFTFVEAACQSLGGRMEGDKCVDLNIRGNLTATSEIKALGTFNVAGDIYGERLKVRNTLTVTPPPPPIPAPPPAGVVVQQDSSLKAINSDYITVYGNAQAETFKAGVSSSATPFCVSGNCWSFEKSACPPMQFPDGFDASGKVTNCTPKPPPFTGGS